MISDTRLIEINCFKGIDVSSYQDDIDWKIANETENIRFAMVKLTEATFFDGYNYHRSNPLIGRCKEILNQGIKLGYYHFCRPGADPNPRNNAIIEARNFLQYINVFPKPNFPLILDIEAFSAVNCWTKAQIPGNLVLYVQAFREWLKDYDIMIYTSPGFVNEFFPDTHPLWQYPLWVSAWEDPEINLPPVPKGFSSNSWCTWQYTNKGKLACYTTNQSIDQDIMKADFFNKF